MQLTVMTFNIYCGGEQLGQPLSRTADVVRAGGADVCVLQEQRGSAPALAEQLGMACHDVGHGVAILSRWPIAHTAPHRATLATDAGPLVVAGVHLTAYPYGPYDLRDDPALPPAALVATAANTRGAEVAALLAELAPTLDDGLPLVLCGDFNEPSHLDWPDVPWPTSTALAARLTDSVRALHPDAAAHPFHTWTPAPGDREVHDRIDVVYHAGPLTPLRAALVGERDVTPFPSDHRAVSVTFEMTTA